MSETLVLSGDENVPAMPLSDAGVNHLRLMLAWFRCEYMLDEDMQRGFLIGATHSAAEMPHRREIIDEIVERQSKHINHVPAYVRRAVKALTKAVREHDRRSGIHDAPTDMRSVGPEAVTTQNATEVRIDEKPTSELLPEDKLRQLNERGIYPYSYD